MKIEILHEVDIETLNQLIALDNLVFSQQDCGTTAQCLAWLETNNQIYTILRVNGQIVGYINFMPLALNTYTLFKSGKIKDYNLGKNDLVPFVRNGHHKCLFDSIVLKKEFRDHKFVNILWRGLQKHLKKNHFFVDEILCDCVSMDGIKFVYERLCTQYVGNSNQGKLYVGNFARPRKRPKLKYVPLTRNNVKIAGKIQYKIFNETNCVCYADYLREIDGDQSMTEDFLVYHKRKPIGIVGLNKQLGTKKEVFMNWLGVLPKYRNKGFGTNMIFFIFGLARKQNYTTFRLNAFEKLNTQANQIFQKLFQKQENYWNDLETEKHLEDLKPTIYSSNLIDKTPALFGNKFLNLSRYVKLNEQSIALLKRDNIIK